MGRLAVEKKAKSNILPYPSFSIKTQSVFIKVVEELDICAWDCVKYLRGREKQFRGENPIHSPKLIARCMRMRKYKDA